MRTRLVNALAPLIIAAASYTFCTYQPPELDFTRPPEEALSQILEHQDHFLTHNGLALAGFASLFWFWSLQNYNKPKRIDERKSGDLVDLILDYPLDHPRMLSIASATIFLASRHDMRLLPLLSDPLYSSSLGLQLAALSGVGTAFLEVIAPFAHPRTRSIPRFLHAAFTGALPPSSVFGEPGEVYWLLRMRENLDTGRYDAAAHSLDRAHEHAVSHPYHQLVRFLAQYFATKISPSPDALRLLLNRQFAAQQLGQLDQIRTLSREILVLQREPALVLYQARILERIGDHDRARELRYHALETLLASDETILFQIGTGRNRTYQSHNDTYSCQYLFTESNSVESYLRKLKKLGAVLRVCESYSPVPSFDGKTHLCRGLVDGELLEHKLQKDRSLEDLLLFTHDVGKGHRHLPQPSIPYTLDDLKKKTQSRWGLLDAPFAPEHLARALEPCYQQAARFPLVANLDAHTSNAIIDPLGCVFFDAETIEDPTYNIIDLCNILLTSPFRLEKSLNPVISHYLKAYDDNTLDYRLGILHTLPIRAIGFAGAWSEREGELKQRRIYVLMRAQEAVDILQRDYPTLFASTPAYAELRNILSLSTHFLQRNEGRREICDITENTHQMMGENPILIIDE